MSAVTFDTLKYVKHLTSANVPLEQAEAQAEALSGVLDAPGLMTGKDLEVALAPLRKDIALLKWMGSLIVAGVLALVMKSFF